MTVPAGRSIAAWSPAALVPTRPAGIVSRGVAAGVDIVAVVAVVAGIYLGASFVRLLLRPRGFTWPAYNVFFSTAAFLVVAIAYLTFFWSTSGRTVGSALLGVRVRSTRGRKVNWLVAFLRAVFCSLFPIGLFWVVFDPRKRRSVQDIVLRTGVTYEPIVRPGHPPVLPGETD
jgi:uncharacterized RDD family membrane protein YckC